MLPGVRRELSRGEVVVTGERGRWSDTKVVAALLKTHEARPGERPRDYLTGELGGDCGVIGRSHAHVGSGTREHVCARGGGGTLTAAFSDASFRVGAPRYSRIGFCGTCLVDAWEVAIAVGTRVLQRHRRDGTRKSEPKKGGDASKASYILLVYGAVRSNIIVDTLLNFGPVEHCCFAFWT